MRRPVSLVAIALCGLLLSGCILRLAMPRPVANDRSASPAPDLTPNPTPGPPVTGETIADAPAAVDEPTCRLVIGDGSKETSVDLPPGSAASSLTWIDGHVLALLTTGPHGDDPQTVELREFSTTGSAIGTNAASRRSIAQAAWRFKASRRAG